MWYIYQTAREVWLQAMRLSLGANRRQVFSAILSVVAIGRDPRAAEAEVGDSPAVAAARAALGGSDRVAGIGSGADLLTSARPAIADVVYPPSLNSTWVCERVVTSIEGDALQASGAWRLLGGTGEITKPERYVSRFVDQPAGGRLAVTGLDGRAYLGVVLDRGFELDARLHGADVSWSKSLPDFLAYARNDGGRGSAAELKVVQRTVELPSEKGWGSNELIRITTDPGSLFQIDYAARVQRRFRRANDPATGVRVVEGLEIVKTYRVLDGIAGVEYPTSTTKSTLRLVRPT
jgi:hypothetical protein